jgi:GH15 family glucan-1,4-alpha-glucosidase
MAAIEEYGLVGDTRTAALVAADGSIDWLCVPSFDGVPVFARLLGGPDGGRFLLGPAGPATVSTRRYRLESATLETTWVCPQGTLTLTEAMVAEVAGELLPTTLLVRRLSASGGAIEARLEFDPRFGERHGKPRVQRRGNLLFCSWRGIVMAVDASPRVPIEPAHPATVVVTPDQPVTIAVGFADREPLVQVPAAAAWRALETDELRWRGWCREITDDLPRREAVVRSLLTLRLLTYSPTGSPVAVRAG